MRPFPKPTSRLERRRQIDRAWHAYVLDGVAPDGIGEEIARSWQRARGYRIDPAQKRIARRLSAEELRQRRERDDVLRLARPILADFAARLGLGDHVLTYFDGDGWLLDIAGLPAVVEAVSEIDFTPGSCWAEDAAGTNGPGTALAEGRPVEVFASEHFVEAWQPWSCAAAPVLPPGGGAPLGLVDITGPWEVQRRQALVAAKAIARAVEERLRAAVSVRDEVVRYAFRAAHASGDALVAVDARGVVVAVNDAAARRRVVEAGSLPLAVRQALLTGFAGRAAAGGSEMHIQVPEAPLLVASPVTHEGAVIGAIVRAPDARPATRPSRRRGREDTAVTSEPGLARYDFGRILGASDALARATELARVATRNALPVALYGESGTGKELFAHAIHSAGDRAGGPFVAVNCGSIPAQLVEAELFGYEAGTFTGGRRDGNQGRFEDADGGTLFLDEVSELSGLAQTALLRVLQEKEVVRLGGSSPRRLDVRIVTASNKPLLAECQERRFRRDLYYRLNVLAIDIPPLRERGDDVTLLARIFLAEAEVEVGRAGLALTDEAVAALRAYSWPGNVRELKNVILRAAATSRTAEIDRADLLLPEDEARLAPASPGPPEPSLRGAMRESERQVLLATLTACAWNFSRAADQLGISRMTLYRRLERCGISRAGTRS
ncbi:MAG: sigma-54-dependent Fis family transcriptional regulator [Deltaproteobacteria bacterium]|nr:sigma-54-dependent Fis family transcriptional regulator [Deltaproteobacteria bacterium]